MTRETKTISIDVESVGISHALEYLKEQIIDHGVNCTLEIEDIVQRIKREKIAVNLFYITQEAVENAIVHGKASNINIALTEKYNQLHLQIKDDGTGLTSSDIKESEGKGIEFMKQSAEELDGRLRIGSGKVSDDYTTYVLCSIPKKVLNNK